MSATTRQLNTAIPGLYGTTPESLPFAPALDIRAHLLQREEGNVLVHASPALAVDHDAIEALGGFDGQYLNHWHEAMFQPDGQPASVYVHEDDAAETRARTHVRGTFSHGFELGSDFQAIPIPGHTPGATAYLWDTGQHRALFTGDSLYFEGGEWKAAVLDSSEPVSYAASLERIRDLEFDVLVPWATPGGQPWYAVTSQADTRRQIDRILAGPEFSGIGVTG